MASTISSPRSIDLNTKRGRDAYARNMSGYDNAAPSIRSLLTQNPEEIKSPLNVRGAAVFSSDGNDKRWLQNKLVFEAFFYEIEEFGTKKYRNNQTLLAAFMPHGEELLLALNGDEGGVGGKLHELLYKKRRGEKPFNLPTLSISCLQQFYDGNEKTLFRKINEGKIQILDFIPDEKRPLTKGQRKQCRATGGERQVRMNPIDHGFTLMVIKNYDGVSQRMRTRRWWHRSATVLLHDVEDNMTMLIGQDEGTYYGVQMPVHSKTVMQAYEDLIPQEAKGKKYVRQGEWFIVGVQFSEVPKVEESQAEFECFVLPRTEDGNKHEIQCTNGRISKDGEIFAENPRLYHTNHKSKQMNGWCRFYRNTAVKSFSVDGVD